MSSSKTVLNTYPNLKAPHNDHPFPNTISSQQYQDGRLTAGHTLLPKTTSSPTTSDVEPRYSFRSNYQQYRTFIYYNSFKYVCKVSVDDDYKKILLTCLALDCTHIDMPPKFTFFSRMNPFYPFILQSYTKVFWGRFRATPIGHQYV